MAYLYLSSAAPVPRFARRRRDMRMFKLAVPVTALVLFGSTGVATAAPKHYCADLKGGNTGSTCEIQLSDPGYNVNISIPTGYPDQSRWPTTSLRRATHFSTWPSRPRPAPLPTS